MLDRSIPLTLKPNHAAVPEECFLDEIGSMSDSSTPQIVGKRHAGERAISNISTIRPHLCGVGAVHHENAIAKKPGEPIVPRSERSCR